MTVDDTASSTRERVLAAIRTASEPVTIDEVAEELELHYNSVRAYAVELARAGLIEQSTRPSGRRGRPSVTYQVTTRGAWSGGRDYRTMAAALLAHLCETVEEPTSAARQAGQAWGRRLVVGQSAGKDLVAGKLHELGFEPQVEDDAIELHNCPFRELVDTQGGVVCALHAGLLDGLVENDRTSVELVPFSSPTTCTVRLSPA